MNEDSIRVLVVDDTVTYRQIISEALSGLPGVEVVGTAANGKIALAKIEKLAPDVLTLDLEMPKMDGLELLGRLKDVGRDIATIILSGSSFHGAKSTMTALQLGAFDFVAKPTGQSSEENLLVLQRELRSKMQAFLRTRQVHKILRGGDNSVAPARVPSSDSECSGDVAKRMQRIASAGFGHVDVVAVGISTGGPQALNRMLPQLPSDLPVPILIVQHMPPVFTKSLAEDLNKRCELAVSEAVDGQPIPPGNVLIAPGGRQMKVTMENELATIRITDDPPENSCRPSVDYLFRSVTRAYGPNAIGVIMTGMGSDGARGCRQMKQRGASIIAQDEASCVVFGMPREPIEDGIADSVLPLEEIAGEIVRLTGRGVAV